MSTYFGHASSSTERRYRSQPTRQYQSNSWLRLFNKLLCWTERSRQRAALRDLADDQHLLADLGLTRQELLDEANKPFWR